MANQEDIAKVLAQLVTEGRPSITLAGGVLSIRQGDRVYEIPVGRTIVESQSNQRLR